jgi:hypothetical protein
VHINGQKSLIVSFTGLSMVLFFGSSAEFVGRFWLWQTANPMKEREFSSFEGAKVIVFSDC